eukprot:NODE_830_length_2322_cov_73.260573_g704_i1.p1 GENE.NODE_830_length_2322_cov_73.260573_g704_i1~~NODE_830_length_2322_cov_73.260573_g704_i1.p1  ORF type:complete len:662 (+),score=124.10 NODE_830_length_2322_cov_73.260573_g704_i1:43-1986(+)
METLSYPNCQFALKNLNLSSHDVILNTSRRPTSSIIFSSLCQQLQAVRLQRSWKKLKSIAKENQIKTEKAQSIIQRIYITIQTKRKLFIQDQNVASSIIQSKWKEFRKTKAQIKAVEKIRTIYNNYKLRLEIHQRVLFKQRHKNALPILRNWIRRRRQKIAAQKLQQAVPVVQSFIRSKISHGLAMEIENSKKLGAVRLVQSKFLSRKARRDFLAKRSACIRIQAAFRGWSIRNTQFTAQKSLDLLKHSMRMTEILSSMRLLEKQTQCFMVRRMVVKAGVTGLLLGHLRDANKAPLYRHVVQHTLGILRNLASSPCCRPALWKDPLLVSVMCNFLLNNKEDHDLFLLGMELLELLQRDTKSFIKNFSVPSVLKRFGKVKEFYDAKIKESIGNRSGSVSIPLVNAARSASVAVLNMKRKREQTEENIQMEKHKMSAPPPNERPTIALAVNNRKRERDQVEECPRKKPLVKTEKPNPQRSQTVGPLTKAASTTKPVPGPQSNNNNKKRPIQPDQSKPNKKSKLTQTAAPDIKKIVPTTRQSICDTPKNNAPPKVDDPISPTPSILTITEMASPVLTPRKSIMARSASILTCASTLQKVAASSTRRETIIRGLQSPARSSSVHPTLVRYQGREACKVHLDRLMAFLTNPS